MLLLTPIEQLRCNCLESLVSLLSGNWCDEARAAAHWSQTFLLNSEYEVAIMKMRQVEGLRATHETAKLVTITQAREKYVPDADIQVRTLCSDGGSSYEEAIFSRCRPDLYA